MEEVQIEETALVISRENKPVAVTSQLSEACVFRVENTQPEYEGDI